MGFLCSYHTGCTTVTVFLKSFELHTKVLPFNISVDPTYTYFMLLIVQIIFMYLKAGEKEERKEEGMEKQMQRQRSFTAQMATVASYRGLSQELHLDIPLGQKLKYLGHHSMLPNRQGSGQEVNWTGTPIWDGDILGERLICYITAPASQITYLLLCVY